MSAEVEIVLTTDNSFFSRLARRIGVAEFTHALLRYKEMARPFSIRMGLRNPYTIIESGFRHGVVERPWNPDEYSRWAVYTVKEYIRPSKARYDMLLAYARGNVGKRYAFEKLPLLIPRFVRRILFRQPTELSRMTTYLDLWGEGQVCTSLIDDCFMSVGIDLIPTINHFWVLPDDFRDSPLLEKVEEG